MERPEEASNTASLTEQSAATPKLYRKRNRSAKWDRIVYKIDTQQCCVSYSTDHHSTSTASTNNNSNSNDGGQKHWKVMNLSGSTISDVEDFPNFPHAFSIKPKSSSRTYYFASSDAENKLLILNELCQLQFTDKRATSDSSACLLQ